MKKVVRLTENDLHRIVKNSVKRILKEDLYKSNTEIGDGSFPNPSAMIGDKYRRVEDALSRAGYELVEYGDDLKGDGVAYFENSDGERLEITYKWNKTGKDSYKAGKVSDAYVWQNN